VYIYALHALSALPLAAEDDDRANQFFENLVAAKPRIPRRTLSLRLRRKLADDNSNIGAAVGFPRRSESTV
jgi:hypothetical protein